MKPVPQADFPVRVYEQKREEELEQRGFYQDIYQVTLNYSFEIAFIPGGDGILELWPPDLPENVDRVATAAEARAVTLILARYAVIGSDREAGAMRRLPTESGHVAIFFIDQERLSRCLASLAEAASTFLGVHDSRPWSRFTSEPWAKVIDAQALPHLAVDDRRLLQR